MQFVEYSSIPIVAMRGIVVLPGDVISFDVGRERSISAIKAAVANNGRVVLISQKDARKNDVTPDDLYMVGTFCVATQIVKLPNSESYRVFAEAKTRAEVLEFRETEPYFTANVVCHTEDECDEHLTEVLRRRINALLSEFSKLSGKLPPEHLTFIENLKQAGAYADAVAVRTVKSLDDRQKVLETFDTGARLNLVYALLAHEVELLKLDNNINTLTKNAIDKAQKEYYLREKMRIIRQELGEDEQSLADEFRARMEKKDLPDNIREKLNTEINRFSSLPPSSHEAPSTRAYIECILDLPWKEKTVDNIDIAAAAQILDREHFGMKKVKQRVLESLSVFKRTNKLSGQILCFVGPPGVGKTSISSCVAEAVGRNFVRMSLGGIDDEAEIRGHRRTYIGAMPGRIIAAMKQAKSINPVILFDEIDKLNKNIHGDPAAAMLEVLDSAQNNTFRDHFLEMPYDLSNVMFITTANTLDTIPRPLLDRMEIIEVPGYLDYEKVQIAMRHIIPKQLEKHGLTKSQIAIPESSVLSIVNGYTRESGVRELERMITMVCRKASCELYEGKNRLKLTEKRVVDYLGAPRYISDDEISDIPEVGVTNGLAWTSVGGTMLNIEVQIVPGSGKTELTGNLGDVMKESAHAAITYIRAHAQELHILKEAFTENDIHIHVPEGATPKDGPSAGITIMTAVASALTHRPVLPRLAMTGEITLRGRVLRIGGLREKMLAAVRSNMQVIIVPEQNRSDVAEIEQEITSKLHIVYASDASLVLKTALLEETSYNTEVRRIAVASTESVSAKR